MATTSTPTATTTISGLTSNAQKTNASSTKLSADYNNFLRLLTTQLQNQDPLNPMDSNEFTNQLVQFNQVEQQINSNQKLDSLLALQMSSATSTALGYVGMDASYISSDAYFDGASPVNLTYSLGEASSKATMRIVDENGDTVYTKDVNGATGKNEVSWDGKDSNGQVVKKGTYTVYIDALNAAGKAITPTIVTEGRVHGIETQDGAIMLLIGDRAVSIANVLNAKLPDTTTPTTTTSTTTGS